MRLIQSENSGISFCSSIDAVSVAPQSSRIWCSLYPRRLDSANDFRTPVLQFINAAHCKNEQISIQKKTVETVNYAIAAKEYRSIYRLCLRKSFNAPLHCNAIIKVQILTNGHSFEITIFFPPSLPPERIASQTLSSTENRWSCTQQKNPLHRCSANAYLNKTLSNSHRMRCDC